MVPSGTRRRTRLTGLFLGKGNGGGHVWAVDPAALSGLDPTPDNVTHLRLKAEECEVTPEKLFKDKINYKGPVSCPPRTN